MPRRRKKGPRENNGRLSRAKEHAPEFERVMFEEGPQQTVLQARRRQLEGVRTIAEATRPVSKDEANAKRLSERGFVLGRMCADGLITPEMRAAGNDFCARYLAYARTNGIPSPNPKGAALDRIGGQSTRPDRMRAAMTAKAEYNRDRAILRQCSAGTYGAVMRACVREAEAAPHLVREGLLALVRAGR